MNENFGIEHTNPLITFAACMILTIFMSIWEYIETKDKNRVKFCIKTSVASSIFMISFINLMYFMFPTTFTGPQSHE